MPVDKPDYGFPTQLTLDIDDDSVMSASALTPEARQIAEAAKAAFDERKDVAWMDTYIKLREGGWSWRVAAYIAWASSPKPRTPKTQDELATKYLGLGSDRAIFTWRKRNPIIDDTVGMLQSSALWEYRAEVFTALTVNAIKPDYKTHNDRKLFLEMTGDYVPSAKLAAMITKNGVSNNELADMSDDDLLDLARKLRDQAKTEND